MPVRPNSFTLTCARSIIYVANFLQKRLVSYGKDLPCDRQRFYPGQRDLRSAGAKATKYHNPERENAEVSFCGFGQSQECDLQIISLF